MICRFKGKFFYQGMLAPQRVMPFFLYLLAYSSRPAAAQKLDIPDRNFKPFLF